ncbi:MAG: hypothetical protein NC397_09420 [Clostridium sp.]|nr:hypothetical protein [Clostridium sp.]
MKKEYKELYNSIKPDSELLYSTLDKADKKTSRHLPIKILSTAMAFVILAVGGGFGINSLRSNNNLTPDVTQASPQYVSGIGNVLIAYANDDQEIEYADDSKTIDIRDFDVTKYPAFYTIKVIDVTGWTQEEIDAERIKIKKENDKLRDNNNYQDGLHISSGFFDKQNEDDHPYIMCRRASGYFLLDIEDMSAVDYIAITNDSDYGEVVLHYDSLSDDNINDFLFANDLTNHELTVTGEALQKSMDAGYIENGYAIRWERGQALYDALWQNPKLDLSTIKDTIHFTIHYKNGETAKSTLDITFSKDGNMIMNNYKYNGYAYNE